MASLKKRIQFYHTLATLEEAGVSRINALEQNFRPPFNRIASALRDDLIDGMTLGESMERDSRHFSGFESAMVKVGEQTGTLDIVFKKLMAWFDLIRRIRGEIISGLLYPAFQYHAAAVLIPLISFFTGSVSLDTATERIILLTLLPYGAWFASKILARVIPAWFAGRLFLYLPLIGGICYKLNYARFFFAYSLGISAGMGTVRAIQLAASGCNNPVIRTRLGRIADVIKREGCTFTDGFKARMSARDRQSIITTLLETAETSGTTAEATQKISEIYMEEAETVLDRLARILPTLLYLALAVYIGFQIIKFYQGIVGQWDGLL